MRARQEGETGEPGTHRLTKLAGFLYLPGSGISVNQTGHYLIDCGFDTVQLGLFIALLQDADGIGNAALANPSLR